METYGNWQRNSSNSLDTLCDFDTFAKNMMEYVSQNPGLGVPIRGLNRVYK